MMNTGPVDYGALSTQDLEEMLSGSIGAERATISEELDRRYMEQIRAEAAAEPAARKRNAPGPRHRAGDPGGWPSGSSVSGAPPRSFPASPASQAPGPRPGPRSPQIFRAPPKAGHSGFRRVAGWFDGANRLAVASLVLGVFWFYWVGSAAGLVTGVIALRQISARNQPGRGLAIAGIVTSVLWLLVLVVK